MGVCVVVGDGVSDGVVVLVRVAVCVDVNVADGVGVAVADGVDVVVTVDVGEVIACAKTCTTCSVC
jgi:hypothetical protein